jgi:hypothetical protein
MSPASHLQVIRCAKRARRFSQMNPKVRGMFCLVRARRALPLLAVLCGMCCAESIRPAKAQGLIWTLPADGSWVRYEGTYAYIERKEESAVESIEPWTKHLLIQSVGQEMREYRGKMVACRWIEIVVTTGRNTEDGLDPGPLGTRKYRVLVPESAVVGKLHDDDAIPVSMLPIVEGYRKFGDRPVQTIKSNVLQVYPVLSLLQHYQQWNGPAAEPTDPGVKLGPVQATQRGASLRIESRRFRSTSDAQLWHSQDVPFGLAKWKVTVLREEKDSVQPRSMFQAASEIIEEMEVHEIGNNAKQLPDFLVN